jgi:GrpB-like predicted nucleotidyltransferase (UPF0157 family)
MARPHHARARGAELWEHRDRPFDVLVREVTEHPAQQQDVRRHCAHVGVGKRCVAGDDIDALEAGAASGVAGQAYVVLVELDEAGLDVSSTPMTGECTDDVVALAGTETDRPNPPFWQPLESLAHLSLDQRQTRSEPRVGVLIGLMPGSPIHRILREYGQMDSAERRRAAAQDLARAGEREASVEIVEYDPAWPVAFNAERERIGPLLSGAEIHHFGSTAVPGLAAKPVIDMIALVDELDAPIARLTSTAGYQFPEAYNKTLQHRRFLCYPSASVRTHHLHLVDEPEELERRLRFRDRLRTDVALARRYAILKRALAERHREDREAYTEAKVEFIRSALRER